MHAVIQYLQQFKTYYVSSILSPILSMLSTSLQTPKRERPFPTPRIHQPTHGSSQDDVPLNIPFCYYPKDYQGYHFTNLTASDLGYEGYMSRNISSGYPGDVDELHFEVRMETDSRIRIKVCCVLCWNRGYSCRSMLELKKDKIEAVISLSHNINIKIIPLNKSAELWMMNIDKVPHPAKKKKHTFLLQVVESIDNSNFRTIVIKVN